MGGLSWKHDELLKLLSQGRPAYLVANIRGFVLLREEPDTGLCRLGVYHSSVVRDLEDAALVLIGEPLSEMPDYPPESSDIPLWSSIELTTMGEDRVLELRRIS